MKEMMKKLQIITYLLLIYSFMHRKFLLDLFIIQMQKKQGTRKEERALGKKRIYYFRFLFLYPNYMKKPYKYFMNAQQKIQPNNN